MRILFVWILSIYIYGCGTHHDSNSTPAHDQPAKDDGDTNDGGTPGGETPDGETPDGETPDGETPDGETPDDRQVEIRFHENTACANGSYDVEKLDVELFNLNLDLSEDEKKTCIVTIIIKGREGEYIEASEFSAQAMAYNVEHKAKMSISLQFNHLLLWKDSDKTKVDGDLYVSAKAYGISKCGKDAKITTKIKVQTKKALLTFDQAVSSSSVGYKYSYKKCRS